MPTTSNFGWTTPADTDLVKDGASAIRTLGNNIDASLVDLKGGTTGQVLAKNSNTDLDFTWSSVDPLTILDAKGDLISATAADTPARLAVGADGTYLQADSSTATGLKWGTVSGGGYTLLSTTTLSGASTTISSISQSYKHLLIYVYGVTNATSNGGTRIAPNGDTTLCDFMSSTVSAGTSMSADGRLQLSGSEEVLRTDANNVTQMMIWNYSSTTFVKAAMWSSGYVHPTDGKRACTAGGQYKSNSAISSLVFANFGGNFNSGTVLLYGVS